MRIKLTELIPGDILKTDVYNRYGSLLLPKGHRIIRSDIQVLERNSVLSVKVHRTGTEIHDDTQLLEFYSNSSFIMKTILERVRTDKKIPYDDIREITIPLVKYVFEKPGVPTHLAKVQSVDQYTYEHSINVGLFSAAIGKWLHLPLEEVLTLATAGLLHDFGKTQIPLEVLNKPGRLTEDEMKLMQRHTEFGYELIRKSPELTEDIAKAALSHHERLNGSGYPYGLKEPDIPFTAKVVMVADIFDAMTSNRVYKQNRSPFRAFEIISSERFGLLDPHISGIFLDNIVQSYIGSHVRLSNGMKGEVVFIPPTSPGRPTIRVEDDFLILSELPDLGIQELVLN